MCGKIWISLLREGGEGGIEGLLPGENNRLKAWRYRSSALGR